MTNRICFLGRASHHDRFQPLSKLLKQDYNICAKTLIYRDDATLRDIEAEITNIGNEYRAVVCWVDPIFPDDDGNETSRESSDKLGTAGLDNMLRRISEKGILVSTHPDIISKIGTSDMYVIPTGSKLWPQYGQGKMIKYVYILRSP